MVPNINEDHINYGAEVNDERTKEAYWICLAFLIYDDLKKKNPTSVQDNQTLSSNLDFAFTDLNMSRMVTGYGMIFWTYWIYWHRMKKTGLIIHSRKENALKELLCILMNFVKTVGTG